MRQKIMFLLVLLSFYLLPVFAIELEGDSIELILLPSIEERIDVGFSSGSVSESTSVIPPLDSIYLSSQKYGEGDSVISAINYNVWVYWRIVSNEKIEITLNINGELLSSSSEDRINWRVREYKENSEGTGVVTDGEIYASTFDESTSRFSHVKDADQLRDINSRRLIVEAEISADDFLNYSISTYTGALEVEVTTVT